ncbi:hypothetical protein HJC23_011575 [Cyclotella cryptica]|uniref:Ubiquitin-activating enzyme E1 C-terminal domain-containing protein n=1 Tax=Cyclotella cryptica TaxID=29204 RepID=A0ABD3QRT4_9STRA|eukprot:CCRYP_002673-RA/>CCRYP_002673-RA protein AED:0.05 eAED:-0.06 QI:0/-1/0/1/-1/1/1/0/1397
MEFFRHYSLIVTLILLAPAHRRRFTAASSTNFTPRPFSSTLHRWRRDVDFLYNEAMAHSRGDLARNTPLSLGCQLSKNAHRSGILGEVARRSFLSTSRIHQLRGGAANGDEEHTTETKDMAFVEADLAKKDGNKKANKNKKQDHDEERYSRQMYALGARAHGLVRSTTAILDGPLGMVSRPRSARVSSRGEHGFRSLHESESDGPNSASSGKEIPSGLLYEIAKNLALSGVGRIILVQNSGIDVGYFDGAFDDLGAAYYRAALSEVFPSRHADDAGKDREEDILEVENEDYSDELDDGLGVDGAVLLGEYIQRLNPGVQVDIVSRAKLLELLRSSEEIAQDGGEWDNDEERTISLGSNPVVVCIDRSISAMLEMNDACRHKFQVSKSPPIPFVSVKTAGVYSQIFCDFGPSFVVVDENGETPRSTLIDKIEGNDDDDELLTVHCLEGERHDVSRGDIIEFQGDQSADFTSRSPTFPQCEVVSVKSPTCFTVKDREEHSSKNESLLNVLLEGKALSFSRVKIPRTISFSSLRDILHPTPPAAEDDQTDVKTECWDDDTLFAPSDLDKSFDPVRRKAIMAAMGALDKFVAKYGRLPCGSSKSNGSGSLRDSAKQKRTDLERFQSLIQKITNAESTKNWEKIITQFSNTCRAKFTPVQALAGALGAQEVLKAATGLYNPVRQFLLYDCDEVLEPSCNLREDSDKNEDDDSNRQNLVAKGQSYILGHQLSEKLASSRIFLVGAGAIGCELLKNLSAMGAGTFHGGRLIITDMDTIEKSNLSRQLLFRDHDVGEFKSAAARTAVLRFLPTCHIEAHTSRVGEEEEGPFDDDFWSSGCDVVLNALDNVEARLFVDGQCVSNGRGLIDAGTLGPKGNVQVVVPYKSESYGSSADPPEPDIPVCTLKNFPYDISHTIQWARDLFDGYFHRRPRQANDHVEEIAKMEDLTGFAQLLVRKFGEDAALDMAEELGEDIGVFPFTVGELDSNDPEHFLAVKRASLNWAIEQADRLFFTAIEELLRKHPVDSVDEDGTPFWTGSRRVPTPLRFKTLDVDEDEVSAKQVIINERIAQFVQSAARLRMETFLQKRTEDGLAPTLVSLEDALSSLEEHSSTIQSKKEGSVRNISDNRGSNLISDVLEQLNGAKTGASFLPCLNLIDFEKDDEANGHVSFVTAASNLRALAYGIPPADAMETRRVAGSIVPAMITTTGLVSALSCLELMKMLKSLPLTMHRNAFVNLALPFFAFTAPLPAHQFTGVNGRKYTMWDRIVVKGSTKSPVDAMTLRKFLDKVKKLAGLGNEIEVSNVSYGPYMIYANFLNSDDEELLGSPVMDAVRSAVISEEGFDDILLNDGSEADQQAEKIVHLTTEQQATLSRLAKKRYIDFSVVVEHIETGEEFELPPIRLVR